VWECFGLQVSGNNVPPMHVGTIYFACFVWESFGLHVSGNTVPPMHVGTLYVACLCGNSLVYMSLGTL
jgi:hypothetical protein